MIKQHRIPLLIIVLALVVSLIPVSLGIDGQLSKMLQVTITVFALARGLNAILSVAQGTELSIEPMGVGLTLTPGEILDPLNDLIEQFSSILLLASASLGIQQIILLLSDKPFVQFGLAASIVVMLVVYILPISNDVVRKVLLKLVIVVTILRLMVPVSVLVSYQIQMALSQQRDNAVSVLENTQTEVQQYTHQHSKTDSNWWDGLKNSLDIEQGLNKIQQHSETAVKAAVYLLAEFVLVMVLLPILCMLLFVRLFNRIIST